ncbi:MAG: hypothetical protein U5J97_03385 [Trueperaceae bacterium]|nr:hypothetical protein [Trueperaceae bacterium]
MRDRDGARLAVVDAYVKEQGTLVILATEPQRLVDYELEVLDPTPVAGGLRAATLLRASEPVAGSAVPAPFVQSATALDATHVLVTFEDPIGPPAVDAHDDALDPDAYLLLDPSLGVREVRFADGPAPRTAVVLTTDPLGTGSHRVQVGGVTVRPNRVLIDPFRNEATFGGVEVEDGTPPRVVDVRATDATTVVVQFDEPVSEGASDPSMFVLTRPDGDVLQVVAAQLTAEGTRIVLTTEPMEPGVRYSLALDGVQDVNGNVIAGGTTTEVTGTDTTEGVDTTPPRVTGATSMSSTRVLVTFSEPVQGGMDSAENPGHYEIVGTSTRNGALSAQATLLVKSATLSANGRSVVLETGPQSEIPYTLRVTHVFDEAGNPVIGPTRDRPLEVDFFGTPVSGAGTDSDGDGLTDAAEQRGWTVVVRNANGETVRSEVTSDPGDPTVPVDHPINVAARDTDQDGLGDAQEKTYLTNPRAADTDGDDLTDSDELNLVYSDPTVQDTDGDGLADGLEFLFFDTSALYADTDGDQFLDDYEVTTDNRNPRIADLPVVEIDVGNVDLQLDVRFEEQTSEGTSTVDSTTVSTTLERSESSRTENVQTDTDEWFVNAAASFCYLGGCSVDTFAVGGTVSVQGGFTRTSTSTSTNESTRAAQEAYARSLATEATVSAEASITRVVEDASLAVAVTLRNPGNVAYTVRDLEITALTQDGRDASTQVPVATLVPDSGAGIHIGPLNPTRGPFRFEARNAFPNLVEQLMQNPRGITFRIANYTLEDEHGRRFAFVQQDVNDRTAGFKINYAGNRDMELYQVATNAGFTPSGRPTGVSMASVLQGTLGLEHVAQEVDEKLDPTVRADAERIARSYSTRVIDGVEVLHRVRDVSRELTGEDRDWFVFIYQGGTHAWSPPSTDNPGEDFRSVTVRSDADFGFYFVQDLDGDALQKSIELSYGSIDSNEDACDNGLFGVVLDPDRCPGSADGIFDSRDSDRDGINDNTELKGPFIGNDYRPWTIRFDDGRDVYRTSANPARRDTDGDGLRDCQELVPTEDGTDGTPPLACAEITVYLRTTASRRSTPARGPNWPVSPCPRPPILR